MKKHLCIAIWLALLFVGCIPATDDRIQNATDAVTGENGVRVSSKPYFDWKEAPNEMEFGKITCAAEARVLGTAFCNLDRPFFRSDYGQYAVQNVWFDENNDVWVLSYGIKSDDPKVAIAGGEVSIALDASTCRIVKVWANE